MNTQEVVSGGRKTLVLMALVVAIAALVLSACGHGTVAGQATAPTAAGPTLAMTSIKPTTAFDSIPVSENPFMWVTSTPYSGDFDVADLDLKLMNPIAEVQDHVEAVANLGSHCTVVIMKYMGVPPETFGVVVYDNPKDLGSYVHEGGVTAQQAADDVINPHRTSCA